jgi:HK97 family phage portal protein
MTLVRAVQAAVQSIRNDANSIENPTVPLTSTSLLEWLGPGPTTAGVAVSETSALGMSAVWRAVTLISGVCGGMPLHAYRATDEEDVRVRMPRTSAAAQLLANPHPDMTPLELWETVYSHLCLWGNAYLRTLRNQNNQVVELWPIHPGRVKAGRESENGTKVYQVDGGEEPHTDQTILHIPGFGYDGICGVSPIRFARQGIALGLAAEEYGARLFGNGSLAGGILQTEQRLEQPQADGLKARWKARATGLTNAHDIVVLDSGAKFVPLSIPPEDAQFVESRRFQIAEVCRMYGIPPHMMMETDRSTSWGSGIEQQAIGLERLRPAPLVPARRAAADPDHPARVRVCRLLGRGAVARRLRAARDLVPGDVGPGRVLYERHPPPREPASGRGRRRALPAAQHGRARQARPRIGAGRPGACRPLEGASRCLSTSASAAPYSRAPS